MRLTVWVSLGTGGQGHAAAVCVPHAGGSSRNVVEADVAGNTFALPKATVSEFVVSIWKDDWSQLVDHKKISVDMQKRGKEEAVKAKGVGFSVRWEYTGDAGGTGLDCEGAHTAMAVTSDRDVSRCLSRPRVYIGQVQLAVQVDAVDDADAWGAAQRAKKEPCSVEVATSGRRQVMKTWKGRVQCPVLTKADYAFIQISAGALRSSVLLVKMDAVGGSAGGRVTKAFAYDDVRGSWKAVREGDPPAKIVATITVSGFVDHTARCKGAGYSKALPVGGVLVVCGRMALPVSTQLQGQPLFAVREAADKKRTLGVDSFHPFWGEVLVSPRGVLELLKDGQVADRIQLPATDSEGWVSAQSHPVTAGASGTPSTPSPGGAGTSKHAWPENEVYVKWRRASFAAATGPAGHMEHAYSPARNAPPSPGARPAPAGRWEMRIMGLRARKLVASDGNAPQAVVAGVVSGEHTTRFPSTTPDAHGVWLWCADPVTLFVDNPRDAFGVTFLEDVEAIMIGTAYASLTKAQVEQAQAATQLEPLRIKLDLRTDAGGAAGDVEISFTLQRGKKVKKAVAVKPTACSGAANPKAPKGRLMLSIAQYRGGAAFPPLPVGKATGAAAAAAAASSRIAVDGTAGGSPTRLRAPMDEWQDGAIARVRCGARAPVMKSCKEGSNVVFELSRLRELVHIKAFNGGQISFTVEPNFRASDGFISTNREGWLYLQTTPGPYFDKLKLIPEIGELYVRWTLEVLQSEYYDLPAGRDLEHHLAFMTLMRAQDAKGSVQKRIGAAAVKRPTAVAKSGNANTAQYVYLKLKGYDIPASPAHTVTVEKIVHTSAQINDDGVPHFAPLGQKVKLTVASGTKLRNLILTILGGAHDPLGPVVVVPLTQDPKERYPVTLNGVAIGTAQLKWSCEAATADAAGGAPPAQAGRMRARGATGDDVGAVARANMLASENKRLLQEAKAGDVAKAEARVLAEQVQALKAKQQQPAHPRGGDASAAAAEVAALKKQLKEKTVEAEEAPLKHVERYRTENTELRDEVAELRGRLQRAMDANLRLQAELDDAERQRGAMKASAATAAGAAPPSVDISALTAKLEATEAAAAREAASHDATRAELRRVQAALAHVENGAGAAAPAVAGLGRRATDPGVGGGAAASGQEELVRDNVKLAEENRMLQAQLEEAQVVHRENCALRRQLGGGGGGQAPTPAAVAQLREENEALQASLKRYVHAEARIGVLEGLLATSQDTQQQQLLQIDRMKADLQSSARLLAQVLQKLPPEP